MSGCIREKWFYSCNKIVIRQKWLYSGKVVVCGQNSFYSGKIGCNWANIVVFGQKWLYDIIVTGFVPRLWVMTL